MTAAQRLQMIGTLESRHFSPKLLQSFAPEELTSACERLELSELFESFNDRDADLQKGILEHEAFLPVVKELIEAEITPSEMWKMKCSAENEGVSFFDMNAEQILAVRQMEMDNDTQRWQVFRYYGEYLFDISLRSVIVKNLKHFYRYQVCQLSSLTDEQRAVMRLPFWSSYSGYTEKGMEAALEIVPANASLQRMLTSMHAAGARLTLVPDDWQKLKQVTAEDAELIAQLLPFVEESCLYSGRFFDQWLENGCHTFDLHQLLAQLPEMEKDKQTELFATHLTYVAGLYGKQLEGLTLNELDEEQTRVLIYAIAQKQSAFLRLVRRCYEAYQKLPNASMLHHPAFFRRICLNSMTERDLMACAQVSTDPLCLGNLKEGRYTFAELKALAYAPKQYALLYNRLLDQGVDRRLLLIRQLLKHRWLPENLDDAQLEELAAHLKQKPFDRWLKENMQHISRLDPVDAVRLLACWTEVSRFVQDMQTEEEACFAIRNRHRLGEYSLWANARDNMIALDDDWKELCREYDFSKAFLQEHEQGVLHFIAHEGAGIACAFQKRVPGSREDLRRIIQAELMRRLPEVKYHLDDLSRELNLPINEPQKAAWMQNTDMTAGALTAREHDDFYTTMQIGEIPKQTCLSYRNGSQAECLLSWFDANKKVLMAYKQGVPVARAMIRMTKGGRFDKHRQERLSFVDLQASAKAQSTEETILFLERIYTNGLCNEEMEQVSELFVRLVKKKAQTLGALPVISEAAMLIDKCKQEKPFGFLFVPYSIYISRSKAGSQYLDSLSGAKTIANEGSYHKGMFYVLDEEVTRCA